MQDFQKRVVEEKTELDNRLGKLTLFIQNEIFKSSPPDEQERLKRQESVMKEYLAILTERISNFA